MPKRIEISQNKINQVMYSLLYWFTNGNTTSVNTQLQMFLFSGEVPWNEDGFYPKNFNLSLPKAGDSWPPNNDMVESEIVSFVPGTYIATVIDAGISASVDVTSSTVENFQILGRFGNKNISYDSIVFPFQIPTTLNKRSGQQVVENIDISYNTPIPNGNEILVQWKSNRIKAVANANYSNTGLMTYAAAAENSGAATWFLIKGDSGWPMRGWIAGTVGVTGSGADLELDDVNIIQGKTYGVSHLGIQMPTSFEY